MFRCNTCQTVHGDAADMRNHIITQHADILVECGAYTHPRNEKNNREVSWVIAFILMRKVCDPSLVIEQVRITREFRKLMKMKSSAKFGKFKKHMRMKSSAKVNIYQRAADLLSAHIQLGRDGLLYHCMMCNVNTSSSSWGKEKDKRRSCVWHLSYVHSNCYQSLAAQLNVPPGPKLDDLLFQALVPVTMLNAKKWH